MLEKSINDDNIEEVKIESDLKAVPVLSFDEELMDDFDESLLQGEEAIIDFVEENEEEQLSDLIEDEITRESISSLSSIADNIIAEEIVEAIETISYNEDLIKDTKLDSSLHPNREGFAIELPDENDFEDYDIEAYSIAKDKRPSEEASYVRDTLYRDNGSYENDDAFYNFYYANKAPDSSQKIDKSKELLYSEDFEKKGDNEFSQVEDILTDHDVHYCTTVNNEETESLSKEIESINSDGFYYIDNKKS